MVTFIVVILLSIVIIAFAILLIVKKGKLLKRWYISFGSIVLAGIICIAVAVPVTSIKIENTASIFAGIYYNEIDRIYYGNGNDRYKLENLNDEEKQEYLREIYFNHSRPYGNGDERHYLGQLNVWLKEWQQKLSTGIYWDIAASTRNKIMSFEYIPVVLLDADGKFKIEKNYVPYIMY